MRLHLSAHEIYIMASRFPFLSITMPGIVLLVCLFGSGTIAAPGTGAITLASPLTSAKTIQVTEIVSESDDGPTPGPLHKAVAMTFRLDRPAMTSRLQSPARFRLDSKGLLPPMTATYDVSDGKTRVSYDGKKSFSLSPDLDESPLPVISLLNGYPGTVSAVPAVRGGKRILLALVSSPGGGHSELWLDPKTHLVLRDMMFMTWKGKPIEVMRTEYTGWVLNKPLAPAVFRVPLGHQSPS